jgi:diguanylate cyclase (GGDEF)-like protein
MHTTTGISIRHRILAGVAATCITILVFTGGVVHTMLAGIDRGAETEVRNVAQALAYGAGFVTGSQQSYVSGLDELYKRDLVIVDQDKKGVADADEDEIGSIYDHDPNDEVGQTIRDGQIRTFVEKNDRHPQGLSQMVVPLFAGGVNIGIPVGALILEYSGIRQSLLDAAIWQIYALAAAGVLCAAAVGVLGLWLARTVSAAAERIEHLAYHDKLTDLPNRSMFTRSLDQALHDAKLRQRRVAVLFLDLDRFKNINDTLGHQAGDTLLQEVSTRLRSSLGANALVARLGGDEFVVMIRHAGDSGSLAAIAKNLLTAIARPFAIGGQEFRVTASLGIGVYPDDGYDERVLMKNADIAMYQAKEDGKNSFAFYSAALDQHSVERLAFESSFRHAVEGQQFEVHYQPKVDCITGSITGVEALLRWHHADLGNVSPVKFIPVAEETGLIVPLGRWVLKTACAQQVAWVKQGLTPIRMAVNLSPRQFSDEHLREDVFSILSETGMDPTHLELEITESMLMRNVDKATVVLTAFAAKGIRLSVDDFGTGYSSLSNLKQFPIDTIKVDRSFVRDLPANKEDRAIAEAIIAMGRTLSMTVIAEGVETGEQAAFLREHGCDEFQGFYYSKAVPAAGISEMLEVQGSECLDEQALLEFESALPA